MTDARVSSIATDDRQPIEWGARQIVTRALIRKFGRRHDQVQPHLKFPLLEAGEASGIVELRGSVLSARRAAGEGGGEAADALFAQGGNARGHGKLEG